MGDILRAYELLNRTFKLGLTKAQLFQGEQQFKLDFSKGEGFKKETKDPFKLMADWEFRSYLAPRSRAISESARASMRKAVADLAKEAKGPAK